MAKAKNASKQKTTRKPDVNIFIQQMIIDGENANATKAAILAGYAPSSAGVTGCRLLKHPKVLAAIAKGRNELDRRFIAESGDAKEYTLSNLREIVHLAKEAKQYSAACKAIELYGKFYALFKDKIEHTGANGGAIKTEHSPSPEIVAFIERLKGSGE